MQRYFLDVTLKYSGTHNTVCIELIKIIYIELVYTSRLLIPDLCVLHCIKRKCLQNGFKYKCLEPLRKVAIMQGSLGSNRIHNLYRNGTHKSVKYRNQC